MNIALNKIEPTVVGLFNEVNSLVNDMGKRLENERNEVTERTYIAK